MTLQATNLFFSLGKTNFQANSLSPSIPLEHEKNANIIKELKSLGLEVESGGDA